jgi:uncharacterized protein DUF2225
MTTFQQIELQCPVCESQFRSQTVVETNGRGVKRTDFHERAAGTQLLPYLVHTCQRCGFTGAERDFADGTEVTPHLREHVWRELAPAIGSAPMTGSVKYEVAAKVGTASSTRSARCSRISWASCGGASATRSSRARGSTRCLTRSSTRRRSSGCSTPLASSETHRVSGSDDARRMGRVAIGTLGDFLVPGERSRARSRRRLLMHRALRGLPGLIIAALGWRATSKQNTTSAMANDRFAFIVRSAHRLMRAEPSRSS